MRQTRIRRYGLVLAMLAATPAGAQPADLPIPPATTGEYPPGVKVAKTPAGMVYAAADGRTLYGMDMRTLIRWGPDPSQYCREACAETWEPLLAPAGAKPNLGYPTRGSGSRATPGEGLVQPQRAPDWAIIAGPQGPQWVYKGWHMVFVRKGDKPSSTAFDGADNFVWNTLKFVPPVPKPVAPGNVTTVYVGGAYALANDMGRLLFVGTCKRDCAGWVPLPAGMASRGLGAWTVGRGGDVPQWLFRGKPVFVAQDGDEASVPKGGTVLRP